MKHEGWASLLDAIGVALSGEQIQRLETYEGLLREQAATYGMIAASDLPRLRERHLQDSLRAVPLLAATASAYDLGSGAGLPGIPLAIALPDLQVTLVETRRKRAAFLEAVLDTLGLANAAVHNGRVENLQGSVDACLARAFARPREAWEAAVPLLLPEGRLVYFAGERFTRENCPDGVLVSLFRTPSLARSGPLVIMSRQ